MDSEKEINIRTRAIILDDGKLLCVRHSPNADYVALPGGHFEWGENVRSCIEREIIEELGIRPTIGRLLYINNFIDGNIHSVEFFFEVTNGHEYRDLSNLERTHAHEISEVLWVGINDEVRLKPKKIYNDFKEGTLLSDQTRYLD